MRRMRGERGSIVVMVVLMATALLAVAAIAVDVGGWFRAQRKLQGAADAAVLAGAQDLPNQGTASSTAVSYANANDSGFLSWSPTFPSTTTIDVTLSKNVPGFFSKLVGINSKRVSAHARAQVGAPASLKNVGAIVVNQNRACQTGQDCFGPSHLQDLNFDGSPGAGAAAGLVDLRGHNASQSACTSSASTSDIKIWIEDGYGSTPLPVNEWYGSPPGAKNGVQSSMNAVAALYPPGKILFFPVFDTGSPTACGGQGGFHIIGWSAFIVTQVVIWNNSGSGSHTIRGYFVEYIAHDLEIGPGVPGFGVKVVKLVQ